MEICSSLSFNNRLSTQSTDKLQCQINTAYDRKKESTKKRKIYADSYGTKDDCTITIKNK